MAESEIKNVVVTGFERFGNYLVNDSWECVKKLKELNIEEELGASLITKEIPVVYSASDVYVDSLWNDHNPSLVVHVGIHPEECIKIEKTAGRTGYNKLDEINCCPLTGCCPAGNEETISTQLDINNIIELTDTNGITLIESNNAGKFLCEYTYYISLSKYPNKTMFVHIPSSNSIHSVESKAEVLKNIIIAAYKQVNK